MFRFSALPKRWIRVTAPVRARLRVSPAFLIKWPAMGAGEEKLQLPLESRRRLYVVHYCQPQALRAAAAMASAPLEP